MTREIISEINSGTVHITEDVLISIAAVEAGSIEGVGVTPFSVVDRFSGKNSNKEIDVTIDDGNVYMTINISVEYGINLLNVSQELQSRVKERIESMTGLNVNEINIIVSNILIPKDPKENIKQ